MHLMSKNGSTAAVSHIYYIYVCVFAHTKKIKQFSWLLVSFYRHKNTISRRVYTRVAHHTVVKTPTFTKLNTNYFVRNKKKNDNFFMSFPVRKIKITFFPHRVKTGLLQPHIYYMFFMMMRKFFFCASSRLKIWHILQINLKLMNKFVMAETWFLVKPFKIRISSTRARFFCCRHLYAYFFLKTGYVLHMGINFWNLNKSCPKIFDHVFWCPWKREKSLISRFWVYKLTVKRHNEVIFHR